MRKRIEVEREIRAQWGEICDKAMTLDRAREVLPKGSIRLLGASYKTELSARVGVLTAVVYMSPAQYAFNPGDARTLCVRAYKCADLCLGRKAGRMVMRSVRDSQLWKATLYIGARALFRELLDIDIVAHMKRAARLGKIPAVRVDGCTDVGEGFLAAQRHPSCTFYDYTKVPARIAQAKRARLPNYTLAFSFDGSNDIPQDATRVAVVFKVQTAIELPRSWRGRNVVDGVKHDCIFMQPEGSVLGLPFLAAKDWAGSVAEAGEFAQEVT